MTFDDLLTLPLFKRVERLRRHAGSHDKLADALGTTRQTVIGWEHGTQPGPKYRVGLAAYSGLTPDDFKQSVAERQVWTSTEHRLQSLETRVAFVAEQTARGFELLGHPQHGLGDPEQDREPEGGGG